MLPAATKHIWQQRIDVLLCALIPAFLLVDCINGALLQLYGSSLGVSQFYKLTLLSLMALSSLLHQPRLTLGLLLALILMLIGPAIVWPQLSVRWVLADLQLAVKALSPLLALLYLSAFALRAPIQAQQLFKHTLLISTLVLLLNALAGIAGLGFSAYQPLDGVAQSFLGIKGFFYSTNELSAVLLVLSCALLCLSWPRHKGAYLLCSIIAMLLALSLLTKTGIVGVLLLILLVPLLLQSRVFWQRQKKWLLLLATLMLLLSVLLIANADVLLSWLGIWDKLSYVYQQRGISGILLSSRDYYAGRIWQTSNEHYSDWQRILGVGQGGVALYLKKYFAELDWFDLLMFYGLAGVMAFVMTFAVFFRVSWQQRMLGSGRVLLLLNMLLLLVSALAGHILSSGMLWLPWALCNVLLAQYAVKTKVAQ